MVRYCANCGTEVDESAVFCPTCGQPIDEGGQAEMPAAPAWPEPAGRQDAAAAVHAEPERGSHAAWTGAAQPAEEPTRVDARPEIPPPAAVAPPAARAEPPGQGRTPINLPITTPVTLSGWLIGVGTVLGALGVLIGLFEIVLNPIDLLLLIALLGIAATVFFSARIPEIPNLRLVILVVVLIGFGIALDRLGFGSVGAGELLLFLGTAAAAIGAILLELGQDQPLGRAH